MYNIKFSFSVLLIFVITFAGPVLSQVDLDIEAGAVFKGYSDVRIPGKGGTLFSLSDELNADTELYYRIRLLYHVNARHHLGALFAPLSVNSTGQLDRNLVFAGATFPANTPLSASYKFNSYRVFYRYDFLRKEKLKLGVGFTVKIRDARIAVQTQGLASEKTNVGFVPILHFRLAAKFNDRFAFLLEGDALAAPQGRAEDVLAALMMQASGQVSLKLGYRLLEGGADNDEVYNFALLHYTALGAIIHL